MGTPNKLKELAILLVRMRTAQAAYFRLRTTPEMDAMRIAERAARPVYANIGRNPHLFDLATVRLAQAATDVQSAQKLYFQRRSPELLIESKRLEKILDELIAETIRPSNLDQQPALFGQPIVADAATCEGGDHE